MKLVTFLHDNKEAVGVLTEDGAAVRPLPFADMNALIQASREALLAAVKGAAATLPLSAVTLLAPIPRPRQDVICLGINYKAHTEEAARYSSEAFTKERPIPINFSKRVTEAVAPEGDIESHPGLYAAQIQAFGQGPDKSRFIIHQQYAHGPYLRAEYA